MLVRGGVEREVKLSGGSAAHQYPAIARQHETEAPRERLARLRGDVDQFPDEVVEDLDVPERR